MKQPKRSLRINWLDGISGETRITKCIEVDIKHPCIHFDAMKDGTWKLTYSKGFIEDFSKIKSFEIVRE